MAEMNFDFKSKDKWVNKNIKTIDKSFDSMNTSLKLFLNLLWDLDKFKWFKGLETWLKSLWVEVKSVKKQFSLLNTALTTTNTKLNTMVTRTWKAKASLKSFSNQKVNPKWLEDLDDNLRQVNTRILWLKKNTKATAKEIWDMWDKASTWALLSELKKITSSMTKLWDKSDSATKKISSWMRKSQSSASSFTWTIVKLWWFLLWLQLWQKFLEQSASFLEFEYKLVEVTNAAKDANVSWSELERWVNSLKEDITELSLETWIWRAELSAMALDAVKLGIPLKEWDAQLKLFIKTITKLQAIETDFWWWDAEKASNQLAKALNVLNLSFDQSEKLASSISKVAAAGTSSADDLTQLINRFGAVANASWAAKHEIIGLAGALKDVGLTNERAGTPVVQFLQRAQVETEKFSEVLNKMDDWLADKFYDSLKDEWWVQALKIFVEELANFDAASKSAIIRWIWFTDVNIQTAFTALASAKGIERLNINIDAWLDWWKRTVEFNERFQNALNTDKKILEIFANSISILSQTFMSWFVPALRWIAIELKSIFSSEETIKWIKDFWENVAIVISFLKDEIFDFVEYFLYEMDELNEWDFLKNFTKTAKETVTVLLNFWRVLTSVLWVSVKLVSWLFKVFNIILWATWLNAKNTEDTIALLASTFIAFKIALAWNSLQLFVANLQAIQVRAKAARLEIARLKTTNELASQSTLAAAWAWRTFLSVISRFAIIWWIILLVWWFIKKFYDYKKMAWTIHSANSDLIKSIKWVWWAIEDETIGSIEKLTTSMNELNNATAFFWLNFWDFTTDMRNFWRALLYVWEASAYAFSRSIWLDTWNLKATFERERTELDILRNNVESFKQENLQLAYDKWKILWIDLTTLDELSTKVIKTEKDFVNLKNELSKINSQFATWEFAEDYIEKYIQLVEWIDDKDFTWKNASIKFSLVRNEFEQKALSLVSEEAAVWMIESFDKFFEKWIIESWNKIETFLMNMAKWLDVEEIKKVMEEHWQIISDEILVNNAVQAREMEAAWMLLWLSLARWLISEEVFTELSDNTELAIDDVVDVLREKRKDIVEEVIKLKEDIDKELVVPKKEEYWFKDLFSISLDWMKKDFLDPFKKNSVDFLNESKDVLTKIIWEPLKVLWEKWIDDWLVKDIKDRYDNIWKLLNKDAWWAIVWTIIWDLNKLSDETKKSFTFKSWEAFQWLIIDWANTSDIISYLTAKIMTLWVETNRASVNTDWISTWLSASFNRIFYDLWETNKELVSFRANLTWTNKITLWWLADYFKILKDLVEDLEAKVAALKISFEAADAKAKDFALSMKNSLTQFKADANVLLTIDNWAINIKELEISIIEAIAELEEETAKAKEKLLEKEKDLNEDIVNQKKKINDLQEKWTADLQKQLDYELQISDINLRKLSLTSQFKKEQELLNQQIQQQQDKIWKIESWEIDWDAWKERLALIELENRQKNRAYELDILQQNLNNKLQVLQEELDRQKLAAQDDINEANEKYNDLLDERAENTSKLWNIENEDSVKAKQEVLDKLREEEFYQRALLELEIAKAKIQRWDDVDVKWVVDWMKEEYNQMSELDKLRLKTEQKKLAIYKEEKRRQDEISAYNSNLDAVKSWLIKYDEDWNIINWEWLAVNSALFDMYSKQNDMIWAQWKAFLASASIQKEQYETEKEKLKEVEEVRDNMQTLLQEYIDTYKQYVDEEIEKEKVQLWLLLEKKDLLTKEQLKLVEWYVAWNVELEKSFDWATKILDLIANNKDALWWAITSWWIDNTGWVVETFTKWWFTWLWWVNDVAWIVHKWEYVIPQRIVKALAWTWFLTTLESMRSWFKWFANWWFTSWRVWWMWQSMINRTSSSNRVDVNINNPIVRNDNDIKVLTREVKKIFDKEKTLNRNWII